MTITPFFHNDTKPELIRGRKLAIIGYGNQAAAHAQNLRDSGVQHITIGLRSGSINTARAAADGFVVQEIAQAVMGTDVVMLLTPDETHGDIYQQSIAPHLRAGMALGFAHGLAVHFGVVVPPADIDVFLVAPKGPGAGLRAAFQAGGGLPCLVAVAQDATGMATDLALSYGAGIGGGRAGLIMTSFREECETDLFGEQAVLCGGVIEMIKAGFDTLVDAGYAPEMAFFECVYEVKLITDLLRTRGLDGMRAAISNTAEYGGYTRGARLVNDNTRQEMQKILQEIQSGAFAREWLAECAAGGQNFAALRLAESSHPINQVDNELRRALPGL